MKLLLRCNLNVPLWRGTSYYCYNSNQEAARLLWRAAESLHANLRGDNARATRLF